VVFEELKHIVVGKYNTGVVIEIIFSLVLNHHRQEVKQLNRRVLVFVDLLVLDVDQLVPDVLHYVQLAV
jgi:hypothetical protein